MFQSLESIMLRNTAALESIALSLKELVKNTQPRIVYSEPEEVKVEEVKVEEVKVEEVKVEEVKVEEVKPLPVTINFNGRIGTVDSEIGDEYWVVFAGNQKRTRVPKAKCVPATKPATATLPEGGEVTIGDAVVATAPDGKVVDGKIAKLEGETAVIETPDTRTVELPVADLHPKVAIKTETPIVVEQIQENGEVTVAVTHEDILNVAKNLARTIEGTNHLKAILNAHGATKVTALHASALPAVLEAVRAAVKAIK